MSSSSSSNPLFEDIPVIDVDKVEEEEIEEKIEEEEEEKKDDEIERLTKEMEELEKELVKFNESMSLSFKKISEKKDSEVVAATTCNDFSALPSKFESMFEKIGNFFLFFFPFFFLRFT